MATATAELETTTQEEADSTSPAGERRVRMPRAEQTLRDALELGDEVQVTVEGVWPADGSPDASRLTAEDMAAACEAVNGRRPRVVGKDRAATTGPDGEPPEDDAPPLGADPSEPTDYVKGLAGILERLNLLTAECQSARVNGEKWQLLPPDLAKEAYPVPNGLDFVTEGHTQDFIEAHDLRAIADYLLVAEFERFSHLSMATVEYLWALEGGSDRGRARLGYCRLAKKEIRYYSKATYLIVAGADHHEEGASTWQDVLDTVRHELMHTGTKDGKFVVKPHEFEGFMAELDGETFRRALRPVAQQLGLPIRP